MTHIDPITPEPHPPVPPVRRSRGSGSTVAVAVVLAVVVAAGLGWVASGGFGDDVADPVAQTQQPADPTVLPAQDAPVAQEGTVPGTIDQTGSVAPATPAAPASPAPAAPATPAE